MNILLRVLWFPIRGRPVDRSAFPEFNEVLKGALERKGVDSRWTLTSNLVQRLTTEAYERAASEDTDCIARYGKMWLHLDRIIQGAYLLSRGRDINDPILKSILRHHDDRQ